MPRFRIAHGRLQRAVLAATSAYQKECIQLIAHDLAREYAQLGGAAPLTMDRGPMMPGGRQRLLG